jgi:hypothetical protein
MQVFTKLRRKPHSANKSNHMSEDSDVSANGTLRISFLIPFLYKLTTKKGASSLFFTLLMARQ